MELAVLVLFFVLLLLIIRRIGKVTIPMWFSMTLGALLVLLTGQITPAEAYQSVQWHVILFLLGMFVVGTAVELSDILKLYAFSYLTRIKSSKKFLFVFIFAAGFLSAVLMNDTIAIILAPFALWCAKHYGLPAKTTLFALAAAITTGSVMSPIGTPSNLLIVTTGLNGSFLPFLVYLFVPALISLFVVYFLISFVLRSKNVVKTDAAVPASSGSAVGAERVQEFVPDMASKMIESQNSSGSEKEPRSNLLFMTKISLVVVLLAVFVYITASLLGISFPIVAIAFAGALPLLLFSDRRIDLIKKVDWSTLLFFISMFVLIESVNMTGFFQNFFPENFETSIPILYTLSIVVSQFISNVPYVSLVLPMIESSSATAAIYMTLAAGSTIAGNLTIFGAASNIIIIQHAEKSGETLTFFEFLKLGLPLVLIQSVIFIGWLMLAASLGL